MNTLARMVYRGSFAYFGMCHIYILALSINTSRGSQARHDIKTLL